MGGYLQTRFAAAIIAVMLLSTGLTTYIIAANAQDTIEQAQRDRLILLAGYLRDTVEEVTRLGTALHGFANLRSTLETTLARDPDLRMIAILAEDGTVLYSADRGQSMPSVAALPHPDATADGLPEILTTAADIIARIRLTTAEGEPSGQIVIALPLEKLAPEVERMITLLLAGALALIFALLPIALAGTFLILRPLGRSLAIVQSALQAISQGQAATIPTRSEALVVGDPDWDAPDPDELRHAYVELVDCFAEARDCHAQAVALLEEREGLIAMLDNEGGQALARVRACAPARPPA